MTLRSIAIVMILFAFPAAHAVNAAAATKPAGASPAAHGHKGAAVPAVPDEAPGLVPETTQIETGADFGWAETLHITNPGRVGLYLDSLYCDVEDLDPGRTHGVRTSRVSLTPLVQIVHSIPAGDSSLIDYSGPAVSEHARLVFHLFAHRADGTTVALDTTVEAVPGASKTYASQFAGADGSRVEYVIVPALGGTVSPPGILLVPGEGTDARHSIRVARQIASRGYTVAVVSVPGYGQSDGAPDLMGPASVTGASRALDALKRAEGVDSTRLAAWGQSRGAGVVASLGARRPDLKAIVLQSGIYDLWAAYRGTSVAAFRDSIVAEAGSDSAAWRARSPILSAAKMRAQVLVLHGEQDPVAPPAQAHALVAALEKRTGATVESHFSAAAQHQIPIGESQHVVMEFLGRTLGNGTGH